MKDRFDELLPWYVNGTLGEADRAWMEQHLAAHAEAREELAWFRSLQVQMRQDAPAVPQNIGLARTLHLIRGDRPTLAERFGGWFGSLGMRPGLALAGVALIALQGGVIHHLMQAGADRGAGESAEVRALGTPRSDAGPLLKLNFAPGTREVDVRLALVAVQGNLVAGPGPQGEYYVRLPAGTEAAGMARLKATAAVGSVTPAAALPDPRQ